MMIISSLWGSGRGQSFTLGRTIPVDEPIWAIKLTKSTPHAFDMVLYLFQPFRVVSLRIDKPVLTQVVVLAFYRRVQRPVLRFRHFDGRSRPKESPAIMPDFEAGGITQEVFLDGIPEDEFKELVEVLDVKLELTQRDNDEMWL